MATVKLIINNKELVRSVSVNLTKKSGRWEATGNVFKEGGEKTGFFRWNAGNANPAFYPASRKPRYIVGEHPLILAIKEAVHETVSKVEVKKPRRGINSFTKEELSQMGFTARQAEAILKEKEAHGPFSGPKDLVSRVKGLGPKTWAKVQETWRENHASKAKKEVVKASSEA